MYRFSGATPVGDIAASVSDTQATSSTAEAPALSGELDSEITQLLKSLSKKDAITKIKALQVLTCNSAYVYMPRAQST